jgi:hypothetical protein
MKFYQETTKWPDNMANGIYALNDSKTKMYAYVAPGQTTAKVFKAPLGIDARGRTFTVVQGRFGTDIKEPVTENPRWTVTGSKGDQYIVEKTENGFVCTCSGFKFRGACKHVKEIEAKHGT